MMNINTVGSNPTSGFLLRKFNVCADIIFMKYIKCTESPVWKAAKIKSEETNRKIALEKRESYYKCPNKCLNCSKSLLYEKRKNKFCSRHCSVSLNNVKSAIFRKCGFCSNSLHWRQRKYCSLLCRDNAQREHSLIRIQNEKTTATTLRKCLLSIRPYCCEICKNTEWLGTQIPLDVDHIDGNSTNNKLENLRLLCKNCHAQTPTYGFRKVGKGRAYRRKRYAEGKSS